MAEQNMQHPVPQDTRIVQQQTNDVATIDLEELLYRLLARWKLIICMALAFAIVFGVCTHFFITPMYRATSTIYVLSRNDSAISISEINLGTALAADYIKVFKMWEVHEEVISNLDLPYTYSQIQAMLTVTNESQTRILDISIESANPEEAAAIANEYATVVSKYIEETMVIQRPRLMSVARVPENPVSPNKTRNTLLGFVIGGFIAAGYVYIQMLLDDKYKTAEDIRRYTGLMNLAVIPDEEADTARKKGAKKL